LLHRFAPARSRGHLRPFLVGSGGYRGPVISAGLYTSPYSTDCIIISPVHHRRGVRRTVSEDTESLRSGSFLLIVRTQDIVTGVVTFVSAPRSLRYTDVPAYSRMLAPPSPAGRATKNLLPFRRRSPQSNCPLSTVPGATNAKLEFKHNKGGVSSSAPRVPKYAVYSLPPTLRMLGLNPIPSCS
jgi:hypothetical protein